MHKPIYIVAFYAAILALIFVALTIRIIVLRNVLKIGIGDGGNVKIIRAIRAHSNFAEYVPFTLLLIYFVEVSAFMPYWFIHGVCICLLVSRISHGFGISQIKENFAFRIFGMIMTFTVLILCAGCLLYGVWGF
jgi:uncharacterized protein